MTISIYLNEILTLLKDKLPQLEASLQGPASEAEIARVESMLGIQLPQELRELYLLHNGEDRMGPGLFFGLRFLSLEELAAEWQVWADLEEEYGEEDNHYSVPLGWIKERYINRGWLPISEDGGGNHLGIDMAPAEQGIAGQVINFGRDEETKYVIAHQLSDMLRFIRDTVKEGRFKVNDEEEWVYWMYGEEGAGHFLDAVRSLALPLYHPHLRELPEAGQMEQWEQSLDDGWRALIAQKAASLDAFLKAKQLYLIREGLSDVAPLGQCKELRELVLSGNELVDISPLSGCVQLKKLYLNGNPVADIKPLAELTHLQQLFLAKTNVTELSPLLDLPSLKELGLENTRVIDYAPLVQVKSLRSLSLSDLNAEQLRSLSQLKQLRELELDGVEEEALAGISALGELSGLKSLHLKNVALADLRFLSGYRKLEKLKLEQVAAKDISALAELPELKSLELNGSDDIGNLAIVANSASLKKFTGSFAQFDLLKERFKQQVDFSSMIGHMTDEENERWHSFIR
jgi:internalin A